MPLARIADTALDRTIVPGYTRAGIALRRRLPGWPAALPRMDGKTVAVTGPTSGIGEAAATAFAELGASVVLLARNPEKAAATRGRIVASARTAGTPVPRIVRCDVSSLASVREAAAELTADGAPVDVLVHNAGAMPSERTTTDDGLELALATNVVGPFLLTALLQDALRTGAPSRVLTVSSGGMYGQRLDVDDLGAAEGPYRPAAVYARDKRAQVVLGELWAARLREQGVVVHTMHPGWVDTPGVEDALPGFHRLTRRVLRTPAEGADTVVWLGAADEPARSTGRFWQDRRPRPTHLVPWTRERPGDRARLWDLCVELAGTPELAR
jgi:dehydrogenase/reductase SDR family protein 12